MPARKIPIARNSLTGRHAMGPDARSVGFESSLERDFAELMHFDPDVTGIEEQPVRIDYVDDEGRKRHYTPDYLVQRQNAPTLLIEIKPRQFLKPELEAKFDAARSYAASRGWLFEVWTEREIRTRYLDNVRFLLPYRHRAAAPERAARILSQIESDGPTSVELLLERCWTDETERAYGQNTLWQLLATGQLQANLNKELSPQTVLHGTGRPS